MALHPCNTKGCRCNATGIFRFCKSCRHKLKDRGLCGQCAERPPFKQRMYCEPCGEELFWYYEDQREAWERQRKEWREWRRSELAKGRRDKLY